MASIGTLRTFGAPAPLTFGVRPRLKMTQAPAPVDTSTAEHYLWGEGCDGWHLLKTSALSVIQEHVPAGANEVKHLHSIAQQFFYVLSGVATMEFDGCSRQIEAGKGIHIPAGVPHRFANRSNAGVTFLVVSSPSTAGDRTNLASPTESS